MGAWSHEPFGNDTACDWGCGLVESEDLSAVDSALDAVLEREGEYLDADLASEAIAAVEVIAKLLGKGTQSDSYTEAIDAWVNSHPIKPSIDLRSKAGRAITRITASDSELRELWEESGDDAWHASVARLQAAVSA